MPRYIPLSTLPGPLLPHVRQLSINPIIKPLSQLPTPSDHLLANPNKPGNLRVQTWVDGRGRWNGVSQRERLGGKKSVNFGVEREGRRWGGLKWALRER
ncbi:hypothetical protein I204_06359 [Kwoniella mangroviensis CBS 8886]|uniref:uncharacterized protein n=1 Tax=Kwoniella mangroviensis CBS 8507 TaxID=1296122 RepID=UPI00080CCE09|nr:uncharacterized protein I203_06496 [Kwoniella mangroviensis CBS 8507]OCF64315.1 hypothetical protein I203_06496 [Kwoniella mangroviensis CBS 8507]OCF73129.1 hypothetical protein I204_06359 [Kwoniella mangroviensis CBS 8886]